MKEKMTGKSEEWKKVEKREEKENRNACLIIDVSVNWKKSFNVILAEQDKIYVTWRNLFEYFSVFVSNHYSKYIIPTLKMTKTLSTRDFCNFLS